MINITEIAKKFSCKPNNWLKTEDAQNLINELLKNKKCELSDLVIIKRGGNNKTSQGTWVCNELAKAFDIWLKKNKRRKKLIYETYLIGDDANGVVKIGKAIDSLKRHADIYRNNISAKLLFIIKEDIEDKLHKKFQSKRVFGEWFKLTKEDIDDIKLEFENKIKIMNRGKDN